MNLWHFLVGICSLVSYYIEMSWRTNQSPLSTDLPAGPQSSAIKIRLVVRFYLIILIKLNRQPNLHLIQIAGSKPEKQEAPSSMTIQCQFACQFVKRSPTVGATAMHHTIATMGIWLLSDWSFLLEGMKGHLGPVSL